MTTIRVGLIGAGQNTKLRHIPGFQALPGVSIHGVANRSLESAEAVATRFEIPNVLARWQDIVADPAIDAICIGTWPYLHAEITCAALRADKHVLCEARMAATLDEARAMLRAAQSTDRVAMLVPSPLGLRGERFVQRLIAEGFLGQVREIYVRALNAMATDCDMPLHWRQRSDLSGINILALGILNETIQRYFGAAESVMAQTSLFVPRRRDPVTAQLQDVDVPDSVSVLARQRCGAQCVYHLGGHAAHAGPMRIEAFGSSGTLVYDLENDTIQGARIGDASLVPLAIPEAEACSWSVESDFIAAIRKGRPVTHTSFADGIKYMAFTDAVRRSAATGCRCSVEHV